MGNFWLQTGLVEALNLGLTVEEADAVGSKPFGIPKTGFFGLMDLVGLDLMPHVSKSMHDLLPATDAFQKIYGQPPVVTTMLANKWIGRKGVSGFYRMKKDGEARIKESINLKTAEYGPSVKSQLESVSA